MLFDIVIKHFGFQLLTIAAMRQGYVIYMARSGNVVLTAHHVTLDTVASTAIPVSNFYTPWAFSA